MSQNNAPMWQANGTIPPSRFVKVDTTGDNYVIVAVGTTVPLVGISQEGQKAPPGLAGSDIAVAAAAGDFIKIYSLGDVCLLTLGGTVARGDLLTSDSTGRGVVTAVAAGAQAGAYAIQSGTVGQQVLVQIINRPS